ncbi:MAG TPA: glucosamine-6-phosphate deaminase [Rikenellaceae bacterium]|nr:glucosamine-6-phosphate deaminase [Rikenellaceae bacterium]
MRSFMKDQLMVKIYDTTQQMGEAAACEVSECIKSLLSQKEEINMIFAAAPSQSAFLASLVEDKSIEWKRVNAFHMDEYIGIDRSKPQSFGNFLYRSIFSKVPFKTVNFLNGAAPDIEAECHRYASLLKAYPVDIVCLGIGENGHIAFNDPAFADFNDPKLVKVVELDNICRTQQVHEKCFPTLDDVPKRAMTLTIPALLKAERMFCIVPFINKAKAVKRMLEGEISEECPATILRKKQNSCLYLNNESSSLL